MPNVQPSMPLDPLERFVRSITDMPSEFEDLFTDAIFASHMGVSKRSVARWRVTGRVPWVTADEIAINLGSHPFFIWGDEWLELDGDLAEVRETLDALASVEMSMASVLARKDEGLVSVD